MKEMTLQEKINNCNSEIEGLEEVKKYYEEQVKEIPKLLEEEIEQLRNHYARRIASHLDAVNSFQRQIDKYTTIKEELEKQLKEENNK